MESYKILIDEIPKSLNVLFSWHWGKCKQYNDDWITMIWHEVRKQKIPKISGQVNIRIIFIFKDARIHDFDNLIGTQGIFNGLKKSLISDDNTRVIKSVEYDSRVEKSNKNKTLIEVFPIDSDDKPTS